MFTQARIRPWNVAVGLSIAMALTGGYRSGRRASDEADAKRLRSVYSPKTGRLEELAYDANGDGRADARAFMNGTRILRAEIDENGDGKPDRWEIYIPTASSSDSTPGSTRAAAQLDRVEIASGRDGRVDRWEYYRNGRLDRVEEHSNGDRRPDRWETYEHGVLRTLALDLTHAGRPDRRFVYDDAGRVVRAEN